MNGPRYSRFELIPRYSDIIDHRDDPGVTIEITPSWVIIRRPDRDSYIPNESVNWIDVDPSSVLPCGAVFEPHHPDDNDDTERHTAYPCTRDSGHAELHRDANRDTWTPWP